MPKAASSPGEPARPQSRNGGVNGQVARVADFQLARILAAMAQTCSERGVANVTVADVVSRSGVSRRTFYDHFLDRKDCFRATLEEALTLASGYVLPAYRAPARWRERMRASLVGLLSFLEDEPFMGRVLVVETLGAGAGALGRRNEVLAAVCGAVDEGRLEARGGAGLPALTANGVVGGVLSVLHARMLEPDGGSLLELTSPLMGLVVLPYLGAAVARVELARPTPVREQKPERSRADPLHGVEMRLTYRTLRVLATVASQPGSSNREIGLASGMQDQGQISRLLGRLSRLGLIENMGVVNTRGTPNAWKLTAKGAGIVRSVRTRPALAPSLDHRR